MIPSARAKRERLRSIGRAVVGLLFVLNSASSFIIITSVSGARINSFAVRSLVGGAAILVPPLLARRWWRRRARANQPASAGAPKLWLFAWNAVLLATLCLGFSSTVGRSLRRRGDWFLGEADGWLTRRYRVLAAEAASWMETFDLPAEMPHALLDAMQRRARPISPPPLPPQPGPTGPEPVSSEPASATDDWFYPLAGPDRVLPRFAAQRFGAPRGVRKPAECEGGHCGVDLQRPQGTPVYAVHDGVVRKVVREETIGRGRYVHLSHLDGQVMTAYVHLHEIRRDLLAGAPIRAGELIGTVGHSGLSHAGAHLHFELSIQTTAGSNELRYVDPEPIMRCWPLPGETTANALPGPDPRTAERTQAM